MAKQSLHEFFLPSTIPDRKSAARAVAAGFIAAFLLTFSFAAVSLILFVRQGSTSMALSALIGTIVMILVTVGTWKRCIAAPLIGLIFASGAISWEIFRGKMIAIVLIVPLVGGFYTATRGIAVLKELRRQGPN
jgi:TctA family transporter